MSLKLAAQHLSNQGRGNDSGLVHMSTREISALNDLARSKGQNLTINPETGLPEAGLLEDLLPAVVGGALNYFMPVVGTAVGGMFGLGGAAGTGIAVGGLSALASGNLGKGLMAGLGAYGGAGLTEGIAGLGMGEIGRGASESAVNSIPFPQEGADAATRAAYNKAVQDSVKERMANVNRSDKFGAGMDYFRENPASAAKALGKSALTAAAPIFAGQEVAGSIPTVTKLESTGYIRPHSYDNLTQTFKAGTPYRAADGGLMSLASGGVAYADGGSVGYADGGYTPDQITSAINASRQQGFSEADVATGLGRYLTDPAAVQAALSANPIYGQANTTNQSYTPAQITSAIDTSRQQGFSEADVTTGLNKYLPNQQAVQSALTANPFYTPDQITNAINTSRQQGFSEADVTTGLGRFLPNQQAVTSALAANPQAVTQSYTPEQIKSAIDISRQQGFSEADVATGLNKYLPNQQAVQAALAANPKRSEAEYWATQPGWTSATGARTGVAGLNQNIADYAANITPGVAGSLGLTTQAQVEARIRDDMKKTGANDYDVYRATGKSVSQLAADAFKASTDTKTDTKTDADTKTKTDTKTDADTKTKTSVIDEIARVTTPTRIETTEEKTLAPGVSGTTGAGITGGGTVVNPNGTITTSPVIPGIPVGGFKGMEQVRNAYTAGGGRLGITPSFVPKTVAEMNARYQNTGDSKAMYDYLMGKGPYPVKTGMADVDAAGNKTYREVARPYNEAVMGAPASPNKKYSWNASTGTYSLNPAYVRRDKIYDPDTKTTSTTTYMSVNQARDALSKSDLGGDALAKWAVANNVDAQTLAEATQTLAANKRISWSEANELIANAIRQSLADKKYDAKNGGLMSLAKGGLTYQGEDTPQEWMDAEGKKLFWDADNGVYRAETSVRNGITYKWNPVKKKYEAVTGNAGVDVLMNNQTSGQGGQGGQDFGGGSRADLGNWDTSGRSITGGLIPGMFQGQAPAPVSDMSTYSDAAVQGAAREAASQTAREASMSSAPTASDTGPNAMDAPGPAEGGPAGGGVDGTGGGVEGNGSQFAQGGIASLAQGGLGSLGGYSDGGRLLRGPGDGVSDHIPATIGRGRQPARLADGEFVIPARIVSELGNGSTEAGARALYAMMARVQKNRGRTVGKGRVAVDSKSHKYLPA